MAGRRKNSGGALKYIILIVMLGIVLIGVFLVLNRNKGKQQSDEENMLLSRVQEITTMNLDARYPPTERDAVSFFGRCMQVLYNEEVTDPDIDAVAEQLLKIYDDELIGNQANYPMQLHREVKNMKTDGYTIQNYVVVDKNRVQSFKDEKTWFFACCRVSLNKFSFFTSLLSSPGLRACAEFRIVLKAYPQVGGAVLILGRLASLHRHRLHVALSRQR